MASGPASAPPPGAGGEHQRDRTTKDTAPVSARFRNNANRTVVDRGVDDSDRALAEANRPVLLVEALTEKLHRIGIIDESDPATRFQVGNVIGVGATGRVYSVIDRNLNRSVAVKVLARPADTKSDVIDNFISEAQITASLQHPNVLPVYDLDVNAERQIYFTTKKVEGRTLGDAIHLAEAGKPLPNSASPAAIIKVFIDIGHAVAYAHHKGVVHGDIKPDNIMLGDFGEVLLLDWGSASLQNGERRAQPGTPTYMSPEQARREMCDPRSDIYCLGASLFHAVTLRKPTWSEDEDEFWRKKRAGVLDPIDEILRRRVAGPLLDIMLKAMAAEPDARYQTVEDFLRDLENFQAGLAVSAHRDSMLERVGRWHARNAKWFWSILVAVSIIAALSAVIYREKQLELATWGQPIFEETFSGSDWENNWHVLEGVWNITDAGLTLSNNPKLDSGTVSYRTKLWGDTAIEFDGMIAPGTLPCDISLFWYHDVPLKRDREKSPRFSGDETWANTADRNDLLYFSENSFQACVGAKDGSCSLIEQSLHAISFSYFRPQVGVRYRIRVEIVESTITLFVDGKQLCRYVDDNDITGGYFALYGYYGGKSFDNVRVYNRGLAQKVSGNAVPDDYFRSGRFSEAASRYAQVAASNPDADLAMEAAFKRGLCLERLGQRQQAEAVWQSIDSAPWDAYLLLHRADLAFEAGEHAAVLAILTSLCKRGDRDIFQRVIAHWMKYSYHLVSVAWHEGRHDELRRYLELRDRFFADEISTDGGAAEMLMVLGRFEEVLRRFPHHDIACCSALGYLGRDQDIIDRYPHFSGERLRAMRRMGIFDNNSPIGPDSLRTMISEGGTLDKQLGAGIELNYASAAVAMVSERSPHRRDRARAMAFLGRFIEAELIGEQDNLFVLMAQRHGERALKLWGNDFAYSMWPRHLLGLEAYRRGDTKTAFALFEISPDIEFHQELFHLAHYVLVPYLHELAGDDDALTRACESCASNRRYAYAQRPWYNAGFLLGRIDAEAYLNQPYNLFAPADLLLLSAIKWERAGRADEAHRHYRAYLDLPIFQRASAPDPVLDCFVEWRIEQCEQDVP
jgi:hypothetical protein